MEFGPAGQSSREQILYQSKNEEAKITYKRLLFEEQGENFQAAEQGVGTQVMSNLELRVWSSTNLESNPGDV